MFRRLGATVLHGPTISTRRVPDPQLLEARTRNLVEDPPDYLIADTGLGIRTWVECLRDWGLDEPLRRALGGTRIAARGPKAAGALASAGLAVWWRSPNEQLSELVEHLVSEGISGRRVAFQLHGDDGAEVVSSLEKAGARVVSLPVYVWTEPLDPGPALALIGRIDAGVVDAVTFTAAAQVRGMMSLAGAGRASLLGRLNGEMVVACIGPVCAAAARQEAIRNPLVPASWRLGSLVKAVAGALGDRPPRPGSAPRG